jgi:hypothetical protein
MDLLHLGTLSLHTVCAALLTSLSIFRYSFSPYAKCLQVPMERSKKERDRNFLRKTKAFSCAGGVGWGWGLGGCERRNISPVSIIGVWHGTHLAPIALLLLV